MDWRELTAKAHDLYAKAAECESDDERMSLLEQANSMESRANAAKKAAGMKAEEKAWNESQPMDDGGYAVDDEPESTKAAKEFAFSDFLKAEAVKDAESLKAMGARKDLLEGGGASGGYLVPQQQLMNVLQAPGIARVVRDNGPTVIPMASSDLTIPALDQSGVPSANAKLQLEGGVQAYWTAEAGTKTETEPSFRQIHLVARKLAGYTQASDELLADNAAGLEVLLRTLFGRAIARIEDYHFLNGSGVGEPLGILNSGAVVDVARDTANEVAYVDIANMWARLPAWSMGNATWLVSQRALSEFIQMEDGAGNHVFMPQESGGAKQNVMGTIFGRPLVVTEFLPDLGTQGDVSLIDFSYYVIGDRQATTIASSRDYAFINDLTTWRFVHRVDGQPWIEDPFYISTADTVSPFVVLN